jgi:hypothetical protein
MSTSRIVTIVVAVLAGACVLVLCAAVGTVFVLGISGPAIGNVFSNIVVNITQTP